jgi:transcriptional regulator with XRE-family HTH domain
MKTASGKIATWKERMTKAGHTQKSFCELVSVTPDLMSRYINNKTKPSINTYDKIEEKLRELGV